MMIFGHFRLFSASFRVCVEFRFEKSGGDLNSVCRLRTASLSGGFAERGNLEISRLTMHPHPVQACLVFFESLRANLNSTRAHG